MSRKYSVSDSVLLEAANTTLENLDNDLTAFSEFDPDLNEARKDELEDKIEEAFDVGTNETVKAQMKTYTQAVNDTMKDCRDLISNIRYFSSKTFKNQPAVFAQFGFRDYSKIRDKQNKLIVYLTRLEKAVETYRSELVAAGAKDEILDNVAVYGEALTKANAEQEQFIKSQPVKTAERVKVFNEIYDILLAFSEASEFVFKDDSAKRSQYVLPRYNGSVAASTDEEEEVEF